MFSSYRYDPLYDYQFSAHRRSGDGYYEATTTKPQIIAQRREVKTDKTILKLGKLWIRYGRLDREFPLRILIQWGKGAGYIGGFTAHIRLSSLTRHCKNQYLDYHHMCYKTPMLGITRNGNRWLI